MLTDFQNSFTAGKRKKFGITAYKNPTMPYVCCHTTLEKLQKSKLTSITEVNFRNNIIFDNFILPIAVR